MFSGTVKSKESGQVVVESSSGEVRLCKLMFDVEVGCFVWTIDSPVGVFVSVATGLP